MKIRHDVDATTLPTTKKIIAGAALVALVAVTATPTVTVVAKARHDAMRQVQPTR